MANLSAEQNNIDAQNKNLSTIDFDETNFHRFQL